MRMKKRVWVILILLLMAVLFVAAVLVHEPEQEEREFRGTFMRVWEVECIGNLCETEKESHHHERQWA